MLKKIFISIKDYLKFSSKIDISKFNIYHVYSFGWVALFAHPIFWFVWTYIQPQQENIYLRLIGIVTSSILLAIVYSERFSNRVVSYFWLFMVFYNLPFFFTSNLLINNYSDTWLMAQIVMIFVTIIFIPNFIISILTILIGAFSALILTKLYHNYLGYGLDNFLRHLPIYLLGIVSAHIFSYATLAGEKSRIHAEYLKSLAGSVAHEIRNPLASIRISASNIDVDPKFLDVALLNKMAKKNLIKNLYYGARDILQHKEHLTKSIDMANAIIDMTLADLKGKKIDQVDFIYLEADQAILGAIDIYGFKNQEEKNRVILDFSQQNPSFVFKSMEAAFYYILFNLFKNSLYYIKDYPQLEIRLSSSTSSGENILQKYPNLKIDKKLDYNILQIRDNGPGIETEILPKLFEGFVTSGKKDGSGLGLSFCKRVMVDFGGDISCESQLGKWTIFNLYFQKLNEDENEEAKEYFVKLKHSKTLNLDPNLTSHSNDFIKESYNNIYKKILVIDDQEINLKISKKLINKLLPNSVVELTSNGKQALSLIKSNKKDHCNDIVEKIKELSPDKNEHFKAKDLHKIFANYKYDLILTDIQMPRMDGFEFTRNFRNIDQKTPVVAYTSRTSYKVKQKAFEVGIDDYIIKPIPNNAMLKVIYKWLINNHNHHFNIESLKKNGSFRGLRILIADDEVINIMVMKKFLAKFEIEVEGVDDGILLVEKYKEQFPNKEIREFEKNQNTHFKDPTLYNKYDIIIADINMPHKKGNEAAKEIRYFELVHNIQNKAIIIANSGDSDQEKLRSFLKSGMDDFFIKGWNNDKLLQTIYFWLNYNKNKQEPIYFNPRHKEQKLENARENDVKLLRSNLDKEDLKEFSELFIKSTKNLFEKIKLANSKNDTQDLAFQTHALKGIAGNVGAEKLFLYISVINNHAKHDKMPKEEKWLDELESIINGTIYELQKL